MLQTANAPPDNLLLAASRPSTSPIQRTAVATYQKFGKRIFAGVSAIIADRLEDKGIIQMETKEVCAYGLRQIFSTILNAGTMLLIGVFMHMTIEAILFTIAYIPIRIFAGGYHASTPQRCWAFSAVMLFMVLCIVKYTPEKYFWHLTALSLIASIAIFLLSPVEDQNKPLDEKEHHVYHIRTTLIMLAEIMIAIVIYILQFKHILMLIEMVWCSLAVMLLLGEYDME